MRGTSTRAVLARLRGVGGCHLGRPAWIDRYDGSERVATSEPLGRVTQGAKEAELGAIVVVGAGVVIDVSLLQLLKRGDDLLRAVDQLEQFAGPDGLAQSLQV